MTIRKLRITANFSTANIQCLVIGVVEKMVLLARFRIRLLRAFTLRLRSVQAGMTPSNFLIGLFVLIGTYWLIGTYFATAYAVAITYPIPDLGYCRDAKECYLYCEIPANQPACWSYGKFVINTQVLGESDTTDDASMDAEMAAKGVTFPIRELGNCASKEACFKYCGQPQNHQVCKAFALKHQLTKPPHDEIDAAEKQAMLEKAKNALGCISEESCRQLCETNKEKCLAFMKDHGPQRLKAKYGEYSQMMDQAKQRLGCSTMESCKALCEEPDGTIRCQAFSAKYAPEEFRQKQLDNKNKIGCNTDAECKALCAKNPTKCPGFTPYQNGGAGSTEGIRQEEYYKNQPIKPTDEINKYQLYPKPVQTYPDKPLDYTNYSPRPTTDSDKYYQTYPETDSTSEPYSPPPSIGF